MGLALPHMLGVLVGPNRGQAQSTVQCGLLTAVSKTGGAQKECQQQHPGS